MRFCNCEANWRINASPSCAPQPEGRGYRSIGEPLPRMTMIVYVYDNLRLQPEALGCNDCWALAHMMWVTLIKNQTPSSTLHTPFENLLFDGVILVPVYTFSPDTNYLYQLILHNILHPIQTFLWLIFLC
jgi:hypothetical protein